ncbi:MAG: aldolase [Candidatus Accumulibacter phosphatis]|jgi:ribulose-5-phosphate 4-epimerase/fuculose-1-phosphate aldolase|uniref:3-oxo-tetronate 4-phosphate decarboxylase n=2 Tax=Candidatus Accumulibacter TaxID=327159 RepID=A0A080LWV1_9PROT|nr:MULTISPECIES: aldolase [Candidatus Accumulibacter]KFB72315.1 MAG: L-fuculose phosphate aldolase [Candidatus Accumulibacter phosphatis]MBL8407118.1 aldolase [Accumulibacter sp.]NMQ06668.1 aldolase [Candidatus Accumulibacter contiguus]HRF11948.1 aldolase [Candidatus Accumulibacter phosphatis]
MSAETRAREEICRIGASLYQRGYVHSSAGNISVRLEDGWLITPRDACLGFLDPTAIARVDREGRQVSGDRPSKTLTLHRLIYGESAGSCAVLHTHSTHLVRLSLAGVWASDDILPPITPYYVMKVGHVPLIPYHRPGDPAAAEKVRLAAARGVRAVLLERLGPVVWQQSVAAAACLLEELEETAKLWLAATDKPPPLNEEQIEELRRAFGAVW